MHGIFSLMEGVFAQTLTKFLKLKTSAWARKWVQPEAGPDALRNIPTWHNAEILIYVLCFCIGSKCPRCWQQKCCRSGLCRKKLGQCQQTHCSRRRGAGAGAGGKGGTEAPHQVSLLKPLEDLMLEQEGISLKNCSPWRAHVGVGEKRAEDGSAEGNCSSLHPLSPLCHLGQWAKVKIKGVKLGLRKWRGKVLF